MKKHLELLVSGLKNRGIRVGVVGNALSNGTLGVESYLVDILDGVRVTVDAQAVARVRRILSEGNWTLVHAHGWKAGMIALLSRLPHSQPPMVLTLHNELSPRFKGLKRQLITCAIGILLQRADAIICVSSALGEMAKEQCPESSGKLTVILNGIDLSKVLRARTRPAANSGSVNGQIRPIIGSVLRMIPEKGVTDLLRAFAVVHRSYPTAQLVLVGDGPSRFQFESYANDLGLCDSVRFFGWRDDALDIMSEFDVFVLPSWSEGTPMTVMEAMAVGLPVIATDVGGIRDLIEHMQTGIIVKPRSPKELAEAIMSVLDDQVLFSSLACAARESAWTRFGCETMVEKTVEVYMKIDQNRPRYSS